MFINWVLAAAITLPAVLHRTEAVHSGTIPLTNLDAASQYSLLYSLSAPQGKVSVELLQDHRVLASKVLHRGDPDFYTQFRVPHSGSAELHIEADGAGGSATIQVNRWPQSGAVDAGINRRWQDAQLITLGRTVFGSADDTPYIPLQGSPRGAAIESPNATHWYRFEFTSQKPKLVFFQIELMERDQVPVNVAVYRLVDGKPVEFYEGDDPVALPHEVQALPGNKFTPRVLTERGTYLVSVRAGHPEFKLRTRVYDAPPYSDPQLAVRTGVDYILAAGDSWHANTPRRGGILDRVSSVHQETSLCVACHPTHFSQRAQLYATRNGYPVVQRQELQFLAERFYNNPRPFYGFEQNATWARMISAAANVLGRMSHLMTIYEDQVTGEPRKSFHDGINGYLKIYYEGRDKLPADETNGNTPLVSAHEVAWYAWSVNHDPKLPGLIEQGEIKNVNDLCFQTLALADIDHERYRDLIAKNAQRLLSLQRTDGQWSMVFDPKKPEAEFATGQALWALQAAGVPASNPQVAKGLAYLLKRQQNFGGWMDPLQSFENFRTPFRETQAAVLALSSYYPKPGRPRGWNSPVITQLSADPVKLLDQLDNVWDRPSAAVISQIRSVTGSDDALTRQAAVEALGRLGEAVDPSLLGDPSKLVQRTAAWAIRQRHIRHEELPVTEIVAALKSPGERERWGATRIFAQHFSALARKPELATALEGLLDDPATMVRIDAIKGLWQFWFWSPDPAARAGIEDSILASLSTPQHPWVEENLHHAVYNLADENIRYLYNNWVPLLARAEDRERAVQGRLDVEDRLSRKFSAILTGGPALQKKELLLALTELPLRRADVYDLKADPEKLAPPVYNRIGNDTEQIAFFGHSADRFATALEPLLASNDPVVQRAAARAVLLVRPTRFADVNRIAGPTGEGVDEVLKRVETTPSMSDVALALKPPTANRIAGAGPGIVKNKVKLDQTYFRGYVEPILQKRGKDGYACVNCHATHTIFNATWSTVMNVVNTADPEKSLILLKPTSTSDSEGVVGANTIAHGGGLRWPKDSPEYLTILDWIKGAKE